MIITTFAESATEGGGGILGFSLSAFLVQLITFVLVFVLLKKFAFKPIVKMLEKRRQTIEDGIVLGEKMEKREAELEAHADKIVREARHEADKIIDNAHKESRELVRSAEKNARVKIDHMLKEAEAQIGEDTEKARRSLEKELVGLVSEATEAVVHEKVDARKDAEIVDKALRSRK